MVLLAGNLPTKAIAPDYLQVASTRIGNASKWVSVGGRGTVLLLLLLPFLIPQIPHEDR